MNRNFLSLGIVVLVSHAALISHSEKAKQWEKIKEEINNKKNSTIVDKNKIIREYEDEFDRVVTKQGLNPQERNAAFALKCACRNSMEDRLDRLFYTSKQTAENDAQKQRMHCIAEMARAKTEYVYEQYTTPKNAYDKKVQEKLGKEAYQDALNRSANRLPGGLSYLVDGTLEKNLQKKVDELLRKKEIYEVYPHEKSARRQETLNNISNGKHYRDTDCCVCQESFEDIGKRVNLPCGHDICPQCLKTNKYDYNRHECPKCRRQISNDDFPREYLTHHINS